MFVWVFYISEAPVIFDVKRVQWKGTGRGQGASAEVWDTGGGVDPCKARAK